MSVLEWTGPKADGGCLRGALDRVLYSIVYFFFLSHLALDYVANLNRPLQPTFHLAKSTNPPEHSCKAADPSQQHVGPIWFSIHFKGFVWLNDKWTLKHTHKHSYCGGREDHLMSHLLVKSSNHSHIGINTLMAIPSVTIWGSVPFPGTYWQQRLPTIALSPEKKNNKNIRSAGYRLFFKPNGGFNTVEQSKTHVIQLLKTCSLDMDSKRVVFFKRCVVVHFLNSCFMVLCFYNFTSDGTLVTLCRGFYFCAYSLS